MSVSAGTWTFLGVYCLPIETHHGTNRLCTLLESQSQDSKALVNELVNMQKKKLKYAVALVAPIPVLTIAVSWMSVPGMASATSSVDLSKVNSSMAENIAPVSFWLLLATRQALKPGLTSDHTYNC